MSQVVLDAGHGGATAIGGSSPNNATSVSGRLEKDLTLAVANHARAAMTARGHTVLMTRSSDVNLGLAERARVAREQNADAFVSIHFNGFGDPTVQGTETWVHLQASADSQALAACVQRAVLQATGHRDRGVQAKRLGVLAPASHASHTAACLAELSFITTTAEDRRLGDPAYLLALGEAVASGVEVFLARPMPSLAPLAARASVRRSAPVSRAPSILGLDGRPDPIEHVVVLMLENRSFDHMLGSLKRRFPQLDGIDPDAPGVNRDLTDNNRAYTQQPTTTTALGKDPKHELSNTLSQLTTDGPCGGFVTDFRLSYQSDPVLTQEVMGYYDYGALPVLHGLASQFTICDAWFSSVPGPTWTNRLFVHSGTSLGRVEMPDPPFDLNLHRYHQDTIFDRLNDANVQWRIYYGDVPQSLVLTHQWAPRNATRYRRMARFFDEARGPADEFPAYAFVEPNYFFDQNDQHPPSDIMRGEVLLARVYNALRANEALWARTLLVVLYDEHGGFYDHVPPPAAVPPDEHDEEYTFDRLGVRVPALLISPWVPAGPLQTRFDHTSLLKYLADKWRLDPLGARAVHANSFADVFLNEMRDDTPQRVLEPPIPAVAAALASPPVEPRLNDFQRSLLAMTEVLERQAPQEVGVVAARLARAMDGPAASAGVAQDRVERFLQTRHAQAAAAPEALVRTVVPLAVPVDVARPSAPVTVSVATTAAVLADVRQSIASLPRNSTKAKFDGPVTSDGNSNSHIQGLAGYKDVFLVTHSDRSAESGRILVVDRRAAHRKLIAEFRLPRFTVTGPPLYHAGGCQVLGDVLAVPSESGQNVSVVAFFDVSDPTNIREVNASLRIARPSRDAAAAGLTRLTRNGQDVWLVAAYDSGTVDFYESTDLPGGVPFVPLFQFKVEEKHHQALLLLTDATNKVFAVGLNRGFFGSDDLVLYEVDLVGQILTPDPDRPFSPDGGSLRWGAGMEVVGPQTVHMHCTSRNYGNRCTISAFAPAALASPAAFKRSGAGTRKATARKRTAKSAPGKRDAPGSATAGSAKPKKGTSARATSATKAAPRAHERPAGASRRTR